MKKFGKFLKGAYLGIVVLFMYLPIAVMLVMSFTDSRSAAIWNGFSFGAYTALFSDGDVMDALLTTLLVAVISSILATVIGTATAIGLHSMKKRPRAVVESITQLPMVNPDLVTGISMMLLFAFIGIKQNVGITRMVIAHITFNIPYVIFSVLPKLRQSSDSLYEAAMDLGCSPVKALAKVVIPDIMPGIVSGLLLAFTLSIDDFAISLFTGGIPAPHSSSFADNGSSRLNLLVVLLKSIKHKNGGKIMKKLVSLLLAAAMLALVVPVFTGCSSDKTLNLLNWGDYLEPSLKDEFKRRTGITIKEKVVTSNEEMMIQLQADDCPYDLCIPSDYAIERMIGEGRLAKIDCSSLKNYENIGEAYRNLAYDPTNEYSVPYTWGVLGILYNKTMVDEADLGHWNVLWNEKYSQEIYMYDSVRDAMAAALIYCGYDINTDNADEIKQAADALIEQKPLVKAYLTDDVKDSMIQGSGALALVYSGDAVWCMQENEDLGFFVPEEGSNIYFDSIVITATSSKKEMAEQFIDFLLEPEVAAKNIEFIGYSSANTKVLDILGDEWANNTAYNVPEEAVKKSVIYRDLSDKIDIYNAQWDRIFK